MNPFAVFDCPGEQPLDFLPTDGGFSRIFRRICCIGDSLSSGEFETVNDDGITEYTDIYEQSWGQYLARMTGATVMNFSRSGMTAREYCESFADEHGFWETSRSAQAYILALGVNDLFYAPERSPLGCTDDINLPDWRQNSPTFAGYFCQILQRLQADQPRAKFFLMTMPRDDRDTAEQAQLRREHAALLQELAKLFPNTYILDFHRYAPIYDCRFRQLYFLRGHMSPCGYLLTAQMVASYLDYLIRHHINDFAHIGLI